MLREKFAVGDRVETRFFVPNHDKGEITKIFKLTHDDVAILRIHGIGNIRAGDDACVVRTKDGSTPHAAVELAKTSQCASSGHSQGFSPRLRAS